MEYPWNRCPYEEIFGSSASKEELMNIPGIGESKAQDIINYREENGSFKQTEEIMNIPGIKEGIYSKISDMITI